jgi:hypothetical protein
MFTFFPAGKLTITCIQGRRLIDTDTVGSQDPYDDEEIYIITFSIHLQFYQLHLYMRYTTKRCTYDIHYNYIIFTHTNWLYNIHLSRYTTHYA